MASSEWENGTVVFTITDGPPGEVFLLHGLAHLRDPRSAQSFEFVYGGGSKTEMTLTQLGQRSRGRYPFQAFTGWTNGPLPTLAEIRGFYDPSKRRGYFRVLPKDPKDGEQVLQESRDDEKRWRGFVEV
jgi:hypothetical protein